MMSTFLPLLNTILNKSKHLLLSNIAFNDETMLLEWNSPYMDIYIMKIKKRVFLSLMLIMTYNTQQLYDS